jgi:hypothetical protein
MKPHIRQAKEQARQIKIVQSLIWVVTTALIIGAFFLLLATVGCLEQEARNVKDKLETSK